MTSQRKLKPENCHQTKWQQQRTKLNEKTRIDMEKISNVKHNCVCRLKWWLVWKFGRTFGMLIDINVQCNVFAFGYGRYMPYTDVHTMIWLCPFQIYLASHCEYNFTTVLAKRPIRTGRIDKKKECIHIVST